MSELTLTLGSTWLTYVACYLLRKSLAVAKAELERGNLLGVSGLAAGDTAFLTLYALGQVFCMPLMAKFRPHTALALALLASALCCAAVPAALHASPALFLLAWGLQGLLQAGIHPTIIQILAHLMEGDANKGLYMGVWSTSQSVGGILGILLAGCAISSGHGWEGAFWAPVLPAAAVAAAMAVQGTLAAQRGGPATTGSTQGGGARRGAADSGGGGRSARAAGRSIVLLLRLPGALRLSASFFLVKFLRYAMLLWLPYYHTVTLGHTDAVAASLATSFEVGGALGALVLGAVSDRLAGTFGGPGPARLHLSAGCLLASCLLLACYPSTSRLSSSAGYALMLLVGATVEGPESAMSSSMLADIAAASRLTGAELAKFAGLVNGVGIAGASCTGLAIRAEAGGGAGGSSGGLFLVLAVAAAMAGTVLELRLLAVMFGGRHKKDTRGSVGREAEMGARLATGPQQGAPDSHPQ